MKKYLDWASAVTLLVTLVLFVIAFCIKHDLEELLLETAVFLVSVKLMLNARKSELLAEKILNRLDQLESRVGKP